MKLENNLSANILSSHSMQLGILSSASHAITTGSMFTIYFHPWWVIVMWWLLKFFGKRSLTLAIVMGSLCFQVLSKELFMPFSGQVLLNLSFHMINTWTQLKLITLLGKDSECCLKEKNAQNRGAKPLEHITLLTHLKNFEFLC